jgi:hypothetical protein
MENKKSTKNTGFAFAGLLLLAVTAVTLFGSSDGGGNKKLGMGNDEIACSTPNCRSAGSQDEALCNTPGCRQEVTCDGPVCRQEVACESPGCRAMDTNLAASDASPCNTPDCRLMEFHETAECPTPDCQQEVACDSPNCRQESACDNPGCRATAIESNRTERA